MDVNRDTKIMGEIQYWEDTLQQHRFLMPPSVQFLIEQTIRDLKELKRLREKLESL